MNKDRWLLPEGVEEVIPPQAWRLERLRRALVDLFDTWGYDLIMPPLIEFLDSLLTGTGGDLDVETFKLTDQNTGRLMGIRADITPQAARIDAHRLQKDAPVRLCYLASVLRTRSDGLGRSRSPRQVGVELFGHDGVESDIEVLSLMLETLRVAGIGEVSVDLGHVGIYRSLVAPLDLSDAEDRTLFEILQRKSAPDLGEFIDRCEVDGETASALRALVSLNGDPSSVLPEARRALGQAADDIAAALDTVEAVISAVSATYPDIAIHVDLAELRGYRYKTGIVFAAFVPGYGQDVARGGRYNDIGQVFGRARPATGFSADLNALVQLSDSDEDDSHPAILAPAGDEPALLECIRELRQAGRRVIVALPGADASADALGCRERLSSLDGNWGVVPIEDRDNDE